MGTLFKDFGLPGSGAPSGAAAASGGAPAAKRHRTAGSSNGGVDVDTIIRTMAELTCITAAKVRTLENHCYLTWILPATSLLFVRLLETGRTYNEKGRQDKKHTMGSPHISFAAALVEYVAEATTTPQADKDTLKAFATRHKSGTELGQSIPVVRKSFTHAKQGRVVVGLDARAIQEGIGEILKRAFVAEEGELKIGDAPRGPKEREIAAHFNFGPESREFG